MNSEFAAELSTGMWPLL